MEGESEVGGEGGDAFAGGVALGVPSRDGGSVLGVEAGEILEGFDRGQVFGLGRVARCGRVEGEEVRAAADAEEELVEGGDEAGRRGNGRGRSG